MDWRKGKSSKSVGLSENEGGWTVRTGPGNQSEKGKRSADRKNLERGDKRNLCLIRH